MTDVAPALPPFDPSKPSKVYSPPSGELPPFDPSKPSKAYASPSSAPTQPSASDDDAGGSGWDTAKGYYGAALRGAAPYLAGAAAGGAAGSAIPVLGTVGGAAAGAGAVMEYELASAVYNKLADHMNWPKAASPQEMTDKVLDVFGVKRPETGGQRLVEATTGGAAGALSGVGAAKTIGRIATGTTKNIAEQLAARPGLQAASGALGGVAAQGAAEAGAPPWMQATAGIIGGGLPLIKEGMVSLAKAPATSEAREAVNSGYRFPPRELTPLGEKASQLSRVGESESGKHKLWQAASVDNQINTQKLAAQAIGLPPGMHLDERAFARARAPAAAVYQEVERSVPEIVLNGDAAYQRDIAGVGGRKGMVEKFFPNTANNPSIKELQSDMSRNTALPTPVAMKKIADLRFEANQNFKVPGDAQKHALALAQREAADALEGAVERATQNVPGYYAKQVKDADTALVESNKHLAGAQHSVAQSAHMTPQMQANNNALLQTWQKRVADLTTHRGQMQAALVKAQQNAPANADLYQRFKDARKLFAKTYTLEDATNLTTGEVSARGLARLYNKGAPLTGGLEKIAKAHNVSPKSMQNPTMFGGAEDWSVLDFMGTAASLASGHPVLAAAIASRPMVRKGLLSPRYQKAAVSPTRKVPPLSLITNPGAQSVVPPEDDSLNWSYGR